MGKCDGICPPASSVSWPGGCIMKKQPISRFSLKNTIQVNSKLQSKTLKNCKLILCVWMGEVFERLESSLLNNSFDLF